MCIDKLLKGYFFGSILFLLMSCAAPVKEKTEVVNPEDCEWYVVPGSKLNGEKNLLDMYVLRLYKNGNYVFCADLIYENGTWKFDEEKEMMVLRSKSFETAEQVRFIKDEKDKNGATVFSIYQQIPASENSKDEVVEVRAITNKSASDPYSSTLHQWRNKPATLESEAAVKSRVIGYLRFLEALYVHAIDNNLENPGGRWYPHPIKFFGNKVSMAYADDLLDWYACFNNEAQGIEGYKLLSGALMKVKIAGDDDNSRNLNCVRQMISLIQ
jgi:hypothetical protein